jgi:NADH:ubiquinone oxidoreductase subunit 5 (subunit L)/multisubunit Na+/H+ antiporter MnhA subunit
VRRIAGPLVILLAALLVALAVWAWLARPSAVLAWLPLGGETLRLQLDAAAEAAPLALLVAAVALSILVYAEGYIGCDDARPCPARC